MPILRVLLVLSLPFAANAGELKVSMDGWRLVNALRALETRVVPVPAGHLNANDARKKRDACVFVAGVRHCPVPPNG